MADKAKLYYFDGRGMGEPIRMILTYGGIKFEDIRIPITFPPKVPAEIKSKSRWGQVPLLEFEGKALGQSLAVTRYLARKCNLVPKDPYQDALCDEYVDSIKDLSTGFYTILHQTRDEAEQKEKVKELAKTIKPKYLDVFESIIKSNGGKHLVTNSLTWADIVLATTLDGIHLLFGVDLTEGLPNVKNLKETTFAIPQIKAWIEKRPTTKF